MAGDQYAMGGWKIRIPAASPPSPPDVVTIVFAEYDIEGVDELGDNVDVIGLRADVWCSRMTQTEFDVTVDAYGDFQYAEILVRVKKNIGMTHIN